MGKRSNRAHKAKPHANALTAAAITRRPDPMTGASLDAVPDPFGNRAARRAAARVRTASTTPQETYHS